MRRNQTTTWSWSAFARLTTSTLTCERCTHRTSTISRTTWNLGTSLNDWFEWASNTKLHYSTKRLSKERFRLSSLSSRSIESTIYNLGEIYSLTLPLRKHSLGLTGSLSSRVSGNKVSWWETWRMNSCFKWLRRSFPMVVEFSTSLRNSRTLSLSTSTKWLQIYSQSQKRMFRRSSKTSMSLYALRFRS